MKDYGAKIAELRTARKMTQAQLGAKLNVTSQAVSKWEKGLSEPDMESIRKLCEIFEISFDEFFGVEPKVEEKSEAPNNGVILAYCDTCDKPLSNPKEYQVTIVNGVQHTTCLECVVKKEEQERKARDERLLQERKLKQQEQMGQFKKGLLWGIVGCVALAGINLALGLFLNDTLILIVGTLLGAYGGYAAVSQCIWGSTVWEVFTFFLRSFRLPGVIFTLDLNGLLFLIFVKIFGAILCALLSVLLFVVGIIVTSAYAMIIFPFALIRQIRDIKSLN